MPPCQLVTPPSAQGAALYVLTSPIAALSTNWNCTAKIEVGGGVPPRDLSAIVFWRAGPGSVPAHSTSQAVGSSITLATNSWDTVFHIEGLPWPIGSWAYLKVADSANQTANSQIGRAHV